MNLLIVKKQLQVHSTRYAKLKLSTSNSHQKMYTSDLFYNSDYEKWDYFPYVCVCWVHMYVRDTHRYAYNCTCGHHMHMREGGHERGKDQTNRKLTWNSLVKISNSKTEM